jgi:hypothetical protein
VNERVEAHILDMIETNTVDEIIESTTKRTFHPIFKTIVKSTVENVTRPMNKSHFGPSLMIDNDVLVKFFGPSYGKSNLLYDKMDDFCEHV